MEYDVINCITNYECNVIVGNICSMVCNGDV
jgi:hypothetical protein